MNEDVNVTGQKDGSPPLRRGALRAVFGFVVPAVGAFTTAQMVATQAWELGGITAVMTIGAIAANATKDFNGSLKRVAGATALSIGVGIGGYMILKPRFDAATAREAAVLSRVAPDTHPNIPTWGQIAGCEKPENRGRVVITQNPFVGSNVAVQCASN